MANIIKKKAKIESRIKELQDTLTRSLHKKDSNTSEINVGKIQREITELKKSLANIA